ncbi:cation:dicarboxylate symporter family transporter, partial [Vibrio cholerae]|uniref:cation:dicarboxylate symporter family transporter n=1 Tax=Vibrio cholerae TaxID=666 RepID=UPI001BCFCCF5
GGAGAELGAASNVTSAEAPSLGKVMVDMFPTNPISAMAQGNTLQIIIFAVLFGVAITAPGQPGPRIAQEFHDLHALITKLVPMPTHLP